MYQKRKITVKSNSRFIPSQKISKTYERVRIMANCNSSVKANNNNNHELIIPIQHRIWVEELFVLIVLVNRESWWRFN